MKCTGRRILLCIYTSISILQGNHHTPAVNRFRRRTSQCAICSELGCAETFPPPKFLLLFLHTSATSRAFIFCTALLTVRQTQVPNSSQSVHDGGGWTQSSCIHIRRATPSRGADPRSLMRPVVLVPTPTVTSATTLPQLHLLPWPEDPIEAHLYKCHMASVCHLRTDAQETRTG